MILHEAARLLAASATGDISTRAVCDAAGITQPVLYRQFGNKDGLLAAVADDVWQQYLAVKRAATPSPDPVDDLRAGWDAHTAFALEHPHPYRLVFGSRLSTTPESGREAMRLLAGILERVAAEGRLGMPVADAARIVLAANSGVALGLLLHPEMYADPTASDVVRDATIAAVTLDAGGGDDPVATAARTLEARLAADGADAPFSAAEVGLLTEWLGRLQGPKTITKKENRHD